MLANNLRLLTIGTQLSLVASGLLVTFGYPLVFGFEVYGAFASASALTFVVHRVVDLTLESMIANRSIIQISSFSALILFAIALSSLLFHISPLLSNNIDILLFTSLLSSTTILNIIFKIGDIFKQFLFSTLFLLSTIVNFFAAYNSIQKDIILYIILTNFIGASFGILVAFPNLIHEYRNYIASNAHVRLKPIFNNLLELPYRVGFASFSIFLGFGSILVLEPYYTDEQIGALRIFTAVILLGFSLTPLNPKSYYQMVDGVTKPSDLSSKLSPHLPTLGAALIVWAFVIGLINSKYWPSVLPIPGLALATYPAVLLLSLLDKILLVNIGIKKASLFISLYTIFCIILVLSASDFEQVKIIILVFVTTYPVILTALFCRPFLPIAIIGSIIAGCASLAISLDSVARLAA